MCKKNHLASSFVWDQRTFLLEPCSLMAPHGAPSALFHGIPKIHPSPQCPVKVVMEATSWMTERWAVQSDRGGFKPICISSVDSETCLTL